MLLVHRPNIEFWGSNASRGNQSEWTGAGKEKIGRCYGMKIPGEQPHDLEEI